MEIVLGILLLLALCGSRAATQGLTLLIGVPLGLLAAIVLIGMLGAGISTFNAWIAAPPTPYVYRSTLVIEDDAKNAESRILELRQRHGAQALSWTP